MKVNMEDKQNGDCDEDTIEWGCYVVIQREQYMKACQVNKGRGVRMRHQIIFLDGLIGHPFGSYFKLIPNDKKDRSYSVEKTNSVPLEDIKNLQNDECGEDNRSVIDDGTSQKLTPEDIDSMREEGVSGAELVGRLVDHSSTFKEKTGFSQAKWLNKKKQKYSDYIVILKPTIRLLAKCYYYSPLNILNLRYDSLSQLLTLCNIRSGDTYAIFDSGTQSLLAAAVLERLGGKGRLLWMFDRYLQKQIVNAVNFTPAQLKPLLTVNINYVKVIRENAQAHLLAQDKNSYKQTPCRTKQTVDKDSKTAEDLKQTIDKDSKIAEDLKQTIDKGIKIVEDLKQTIDKGIETAEGLKETVDRLSKIAEDLKRSIDKGCKTAEDLKQTIEKGSITAEDLKQTIHKVRETAEDLKQTIHMASETADGSKQPVGSFNESSSSSTKENLNKVSTSPIQASESATLPPEGRRAAKRKCPFIDSDEADELLKEGVDAILIACKQHPLNILQALLPCLKISRPFAVFSPYLEPLIECYNWLKSRGGVINVRVSESWLRSYQVLPERTHPEINMSGSGGYIISGTVVQP